MGASHSVRQAAGSSNQDLLQSIKNMAVPSRMPEVFTRKEELQRLTNILGRPPVQIKVIVGPKHSGKSKLLSQLHQLWNEDSLERKIFAPLFVVNMGVCDCSSAYEFHNHLKDVFHEWHNTALAALAQAQNAGISSVMGIPLDFILNVIKKFWKDIDRALCLGDTCDTLWAYLLRYPTVMPMIVIDEAHMLKNWETEKGSMELRSLLSYFVGLSKENRRAHVVLVSSDDLFREWLRGFVSPDFTMPIEIGYFGEHEAQRFLSEFVVPYFGMSLPEGWKQNIWPVVYGSVGGSPLLIQALVNDVDAAGSWESAAEGLVNREVLALKHALHDTGYTHTHDEYRSVMRLIVQNSGAVLMEIVGGHFKDSKRAYSIVKSMMRTRLVHLRMVERSAIYKDMPEGLACGEYVMAISPCSFVAMQRMFSS